MNKRELLRKTGNISQLCDVREVVCSSGKASGLRLLQVHNAAGLAFSVIPDKCMDIFDLHYRGVNMAFQTKNGLVGNQWYDPLNTEFLHYWSAGMLCTCGLENTGPSCELPDGMVLPLHGRLGMLPAEDLSIHRYWQGEEYMVELAGQVRETRLEGHNLLFTRKITTKMESPVICIHDTLENQGFEPFDFMLLYHINFGYPMVDEGTKVVMNTQSVQGRTPYAEARKTGWSRVEAVCDGVEEEVFFHDVLPEEDGMSTVQVLNEKLRIGAQVRYSYDTLPILSQWKFCMPGEYVLGIEPGNSHIEGRQEGLASQGLRQIAPGEILSFDLEMKLFDL